jgi:hypothetical protein
MAGPTIPFFAPPIPVTFPYALRMHIVQLEDGSLFVSSPLALDDSIRAEVDGLGPVRHVVSPNKLHHLYMGEWATAYPNAKLYASPGLPEKRPDLDFAATLGDEPAPPWRSTLDQLKFCGSFFMNEIVFFHHASRTLLLGDLIENHDGSIMNRRQRFFAKMNRMLAPHGETPLNYRLSFFDRKKARMCFDRMIAWKPERVLLMHGPNVEKGAEAFLRNGFAWLTG